VVNDDCILIRLRDFIADPDQRIFIFSVLITWNNR